MSSATANATLANASGGRKSASLPAETVEYLKSWMMHPDHIAHPYPTDQEKTAIMAETGIELKQLTNWFVNNRKRYWKPRVEAAATGSPLQVGPGLMGRPQASASAAPDALIAAVAESAPESGSAPFDHHCPREDAVAVAAMAFLHQGDPDVNAMRVRAQQDDPHTISEGSGSSACDDTDDDDSHDDSCRSSRSSLMYDSSHCGSDGHSSSTSSSSVMTTEGYRRHEEVDIYVLRPERPPSATTSASPYAKDIERLPTIRDLTIKSSVPKERILATFKCPISYTIPHDMENDKRRVQSRRDGEVLRAKKFYLKLYLASRDRHCISSQAKGVGEDVKDVDIDIDAPTKPSCDPPASHTLDSTTYHAVSPALSQAVSTWSFSWMREFSCADLKLAFECIENLPPRKRARTVTVDDWREMCRNASGAYDESLPGLEEAARMFGFATM